MSLLAEDEEAHQLADPNHSQSRGILLTIAYIVLTGPGAPVADDHLLIGALCRLAGSRWPSNILASASIVGQGGELFGHFEEASLLLWNSVHQVGPLLWAPTDPIDGHQVNHSLEHCRRATTGAAADV